MALIKARIRQWGGSLGVIIPKEEARQARLTKGQEVTLELKKENPLIKAFGSLKDWKIDSQKAKDDMRKGWGE